METKLVKNFKPEHNGVVWGEFKLFGYEGPRGYREYVQYKTKGQRKWHDLHSWGEDVRKLLQKLMEKEQLNYLTGLRRKEEQKTQRQKRLKEMKGEIKEGAILYDTWGYEQTNVEFYKVIKVKGNKVTLQEMGHKEVESTSWCSCLVVPGEVYGEPVTKTIGQYGVKIDNIVTLRPYKGGNIHKSWGY